MNIFLVHLGETVIICVFVTPETILYYRLSWEEYTVTFQGFPLVD